MVKEETRPAGQCGCFLGCDNNIGRGTGKEGTGMSQILPPNTQNPAPFLFQSLGFSPRCSPRSQGPSVHTFKPCIPSLNPGGWLLAPRCVSNVAIRAGPCLLPTLKFWQIWGGVGAGLWENRGLLVFSERKLEHQLDLEMG